jgi:hypothetical protein
MGAWAQEKKNERPSRVLAGVDDRPADGPSRFLLHRKDEDVMSLKYFRNQYRVRKSKNSLETVLGQL